MDIQRKQIEIPIIDNADKKYGIKRLFWVERMTPPIRRMFTHYFVRLIDGMPKEVATALRSKRLADHSLAEILLDIVQYAATSNMLEEFLAIALCPAGSKSTNKDLKELEAFFERNGDLPVEIEAAMSFFTQYSLEELETTMRSATQYIISIAQKLVQQTMVRMVQSGTVTPTPSER